ncbi:cytochrome c [Parashewanella spongiae]|nr:cytochrome c [Parashewanella spongiae]MCL1080076.1 cytochrome c [Parashewanella spongiae]
MSALLSTAITTPALSHSFDGVEDAIQYRKAAFGLMAHNFGEMAAMLKGKKPMDKVIFAQRANNVAALAQLPHEGFIEGSDKGETDVLAKIWKNKSDFDDKMKALQISANQLAKVSQLDDIKAIKKAFGATGKNCKSCHKSYKQRN